MTKLLLVVEALILRGYNNQQSITVRSKSVVEALILRGYNNLTELATVNYGL